MAGLTNRPHGHLPGIHGLRAIAALGVMLMHIAMVPAPNLALPPVFDRIVPFGGIGVTLFFILSAYSLLHSHDRSKNGRRWIQVYLIKRVFRIAPLFWAMLILYRWLPVFQPPATPATILANVLFAFNFSQETYQSLVGAGWTLGVEMPFYLCVPLIIIFVRGPRVAAVLFAVSVVVSTASRYWLTERYGVENSYPNLAFLPNVVVFMTGILVYHLIKVWSDRKMLWRALGYVGLAVMATLPLHLNLVPIVFGRPDALVWMIAIGAICAWQAVAPSYLLSLRPMQWLGERSFGIYLIHPLVIFTCVRHGIYTAICQFFAPIGAWSYLACVAVTAPVVILGAAFAYATIEARCQKFARALIQRLYGPRQAVTAPVSTKPPVVGAPEAEAFSAGD